MVGQGPGAGSSHVIFSREDEFHGQFGDVGQHHGLGNDVRGDAPAEAATQHLLMDLDFVWCGFQYARGNHGGQERELRSCPYFSRLTISCHFGQTIHRLHLGVISVFGPIGGFDGFGGLSQGGGGVTAFVGIHRLGIGVLTLFGIVRFGFFRIKADSCGSARGVPGDFGFEQGAGHSRGFSRFANHSHAKGNRQNP